MPSLQHSLPTQALNIWTIRPRSGAASAGSAAIDIPVSAIVVIAVGGSGALFLVLSAVLIRVAQWQHKRQLNKLEILSNEGVATNPRIEHGRVDDDDHGSEGRPRNRIRRVLRKKKGRFGGVYGDHLDFDLDMNMMARQGSHGIGKIEEGEEDSEIRARAKRTSLSFSLPSLPPLFRDPHSHSRLRQYPEQLSPTPEARKRREDNQRREKERGAAVQKRRRSSSWIDEDALHGPRVGKKSRSNGMEDRVAVSLVGLGHELGRRLSLKSHDGRRTWMGSPTLPDTSQTDPYHGMENVTMSWVMSSGNDSQIMDAQRSDLADMKIPRESPKGPRPVNSPAWSSQHQASRISISQEVSAGTPVRSPKMSSDETLNPHRHRRSESMTTAECIILSPMSFTTTPSSFYPTQPDTSAYTPTHQNNAPMGRSNKIMSPSAFDAAAGQQFQQNLGKQLHRPARLRHSSTDTELSEILRMTAERLQDGTGGSNSANRNVKRSSELIRGRLGPGSYLTPTNTTTNTPTISPAKSQKSAPAALADPGEGEDLERPGERDSSTPSGHRGRQLLFKTPNSDGFNRTASSRRHTRQFSNVSQLSEMSNSQYSETDSMIALPPGSGVRPVSQLLSEHATPLSSPSRTARAREASAQREREEAARKRKEPAEVHAKDDDEDYLRPVSPESVISVSHSSSSALSTLYSAEEEADDEQIEIPTLHTGIPVTARRQTLMEREAMLEALSAAEAIERSGQSPQSLQSLQSYKIADQEVHQTQERRRSSVTARRGTLGQITLPPSLSMPISPQICSSSTMLDPTSELSVPHTSLQFTIHPFDFSKEGNKMKAGGHDKDENDIFATDVTDPRTRGEKSQRISTVFTTLPRLSPPSSHDFRFQSKSVDEHQDYIETATAIQVHITRPHTTNDSDKTPTPSPKNMSRIGRMGVIPPPQTLRPTANSPTSELDRRCSPARSARSEGGLSSVYEGYNYARGNGSDSSTSLERGKEEEKTSGSSSLTTLITVPSHEFSPMHMGKDDNNKKDATTQLDRTSSQTRRNVPVLAETILKSGGNQGLCSLDKVQNRLSADSIYSQDSLVLTPRQVPMFSSARNLQLANSVAELRRMNSTVSCISAVATVANGAGAQCESPTLPALRGGGFSPEKRGGGARNYLALGTPPRDRNKQYGGRSINGPVPPSTSPTRHAMTASPTGLPSSKPTARPRRETTVWTLSSSTSVDATETSDKRPVSSIVVGEGRRQNIEKGAKRVLKEGSGNRHIEAIIRNEIAMNEHAKASLESLGLYDDKGFLKSSPVRKG